jgi:hypothetical protein
LSHHPGYDLGKAGTCIEQDADRLQLEVHARIWTQAAFAQVKREGLGNQL